MWPRLSDLKRSAVSALLGALVVAALTFVAYRSHLDFSIASLFYLMVVVLQSLFGDFLAAAAVSILAVLCLDYFFTQPLFSLRIASAADTAALISFLATALVITKLVSRARAEAARAKLQKERLDRLYQVSQQLLMLDPDAATGEKFLEPFQRIFGVTAVCIFDGETAETHVVGNSRHQLAERVRDAYIMGRDIDDPNTGVAVRLFQTASKVTGGIGFEGLRDRADAAGPLAVLTTVLLERIQQFRKASAASAAAQVEVYRSAILDALAHEFKTPLATILTAAGGIREAGPLTEHQSEMAETVEGEAARLGRLTSRLLRVARLDRDEVKPRMETVDAGSLAGQIVEQYARVFPDRRLSVSRPGGPVEARADPELLRLALGQLVENACKYSVPGASVLISIDPRPGRMAIRISNSGSSILSREKRLIFDRFYRGAEAKQQAPGSGLGLYVARKIALAHGGTLNLETGSDAPADLPNPEVTFCLEIPAVQEEAVHAVG
jgi:two-component system, OmpR family, sensor histidine kinase KdpD